MNSTGHSEPSLAPTPGRSRAKACDCRVSLLRNFRPSRTHTSCGGRAGGSARGAGLSAAVACGGCRGRRGGVQQPRRVVEAAVPPSWRLGRVAPAASWTPVSFRACEIEAAARGVGVEAEQAWLLRHVVEMDERVLLGRRAQVLQDQGHVLLLGGGCKSAAHGLLTPHVYTRGARGAGPVYQSVGRGAAAG